MDIYAKDLIAILIRRTEELKSSYLDPITSDDTKLFWIRKVVEILEELKGRLIVKEEK